MTRYSYVYRTSDGSAFDVENIQNTGKIKKMPTGIFGKFLSSTPQRFEIRFY